MQIHILSISCGIISFNGQGQLCLLILVQSEEMSQTIYTRMRKRPQKTSNNWPENFHENLVPLASHLPCLSSNPKIPKALWKTFPTKVKPTIINAQQEKKRKEKQKAKNQDYCVTFKPKTSRFCFLCMLIILHLSQGVTRKPLN